MCVIGVPEGEREWEREKNIWRGGRHSRIDENYMLTDPRTSTHPKHKKHVGDWNQDIW